MSYEQEILCALAGPMLNLAAALFAVYAGWEIFAGINLALGVFNLLPISALDGGRILNCVAAVMFGPEISCRICKTVDLIFSAVMGLVGAMLLFSGGSITLFLIAIWIWKRMIMCGQDGSVHFRNCALAKKL